MSFDNEEKQISDALDALDSELKIPDLMLGIKKKLDGKPPVDGKAGVRRIRKPFRFIGLAAAIIAVIGITAAAISLGGFDWLREKVNPPFGDVVEAIEQSSTSQGIKVTAIAAQNYNDMAVLYVTLEDTEGLGRVAEDTQLGFAANSKVQSMSYEMIYFDSETGIAAYQIRLGTDDTFNGQSLALQLGSLRYGATDLGEIRMDIDLSQAVSEGEHNGEPYSSSIQAPSEQLAPGHVADIPKAKSAWVSAVGVNHGYLTVQFGQPLGVDRMYLNDLLPYVLDADGNRVEQKIFSSGFSTNEQLQCPEEGQQSVYDFEEYYFNVDTNALDGYTLCFEGTAWNVITGDWNLNVDFDSLPEVREVTADITVGDVQMPDVVLTISPLGMTLTGNGEKDLSYYSAPMTVTTVLETTDGDIELSGSSGFRPSPDGPYELIWHASSAVDMDSIIAVRIGDNRIELND